MDRKNVEDALSRAELDPSAFFTDDSVLHDWKIKTHPDKWLGEESIAAGWFKRFTELAALAGKSENVAGYRVKRTLSRGDLCDILIGDGGDEEVLIKRPYVKASSLMRNEAKNLDKVVKFNGPDMKRHLFPKFIKTEKSMNVFRYDRTLESVSSLLARYPSGVGGRHAGWITKRLLLAITWAHASGVVHGAVTPDHVMVDKERHGIVLCDWIHSGVEGSAIQVVPAKFKASYPQFAVKEKRLSRSLDVSMACGIGMKLCGNQKSDKAVYSYCRSLSLFPTSDAWECHDELDRTLCATYGARVFVDLV